MDVQSGKVLQRLMFEGKDKDGDPVGAREILFHKGQLFIGGVADPGFISVVDANTMTLKARIENAGKWVTGSERAAYRGGCRSLPELPKGTIRHEEDYRHHRLSSAGICG